jgi:hypothetical protein
MSTEPTNIPITANDRLPTGHGLRVWIAALILFLIAFFAMEAAWRGMGFVPSVTDTEDLWAMQRARVDHAGENTVLILGRSRIQQAFVPEVFREVCPDYDYIQLAIGGLHPIGSLEDIADNTEFNGVVLVSISTPSLLPELWNQQDPYLDYYRYQWGPLRSGGRHIKNFLQDHFVLFLPELILQRVAPDLIKGDLEPQFLLTAPDRTQNVDYHKVDIVKYTDMQLRQIQFNLDNYVTLPGYANWPKDLPHIERLVQRIQDRGGKVVFFRMPTTGAYREAEEAAFPRERFWDVFAAQTSAATLHFQDIPAWAAMECAEGTHLHREDAITFTRSLTRLLTEQGFLDCRPASEP